MKPYYFTMTVCHHRTMEHLAVNTGIVQAESEEEARQRAWDLAGSNLCCGLKIFEVDLDKGFTYTIYKCGI